MRNILILLISLLLIILFCFPMPELVLEQQIKNQTNEILYSNSAPNYGLDQQSKTYLRIHRHIQLTDVTDNQGSNGATSYHVGTTTTGLSLGIYVQHTHLQAPYSKIKIKSIKVWSSTQKHS